MDRPSLPSPRTEDLKHQIVAGIKPKPVAEPSKRNEALKLVIPVRASSNHAQRQI
jgi:hypothetical protein